MFITTMFRASGQMILICFFYTLSPQESMKVGLLFCIQISNSIKQNIHKSRVEIKRGKEKRPEI